MRGYLTLIRKDSSTHMHGLTVYVKEGLPFVQDLSQEYSADSYLYFRLALFHSVSYFFPYWSPSLSLCTVFDSILSNIEKVLSVNSSANVFLFGDLNVHHKDWEKSEPLFLGNFWKLNPVPLAVITIPVWSLSLGEEDLFCWCKLASDFYELW